MGDAAYGEGELLARLDDNCVCNGLKVQPPARVTGHYGQGRLHHRSGSTDGDLSGGHRGQHPRARWPPRRVWCHLRGCWLRDGCTTAKAGRTVSIGPYEVHLAAGANSAGRPSLEGRLSGHPTEGATQDRASDATPARWVSCSDPGTVKVAADVSLLAAAVNLARLGRLGVGCRAGTCPRWSRPRVIT
jgi:hypothetical protein